jgi:nitrogen fixation protein FixH
MRQLRAAPKEFTGRHMLAIMLAFFGTVIAVNLVMATFASSSWTGLVVKNSYVASQEFNGKAAEGRAQAARNWHPALELQPGTVSFRLSDRAGAPIPLKAVGITFRRPAYEAEDVTIHLTRRSDGVFAAATNIRDGLWIIETNADFGETHAYRDTRRIVLKGGKVQ